MSHVFQRPPGLARASRDPLEPGSAKGQPSSALSGKVSFALPVPLTSLLSGSLLCVHSERNGEGNHCVFKHCLMVKNNIWRTALPFTESPPPPHLPTGNRSRRNPSAHHWDQPSLWVPLVWGQQPLTRAQQVPKSPAQVGGWLKPHSLLQDFRESGKLSKG